MELNWINDMGHISILGIVPSLVILIQTKSSNQILKYDAYIIQNKSERKGMV